MTQIATSTFLNLDLDLESAVDLTPLADYLAERADVLYHGPAYDGYKLTAEPPLGGLPGQDLRACTEVVLDILQVLPEHLRDLFADCRSRTFDYGFAAEPGAPPLMLSLPAAQLLRIAELGIDLRVTIYAEPR